MAPPQAPAGEPEELAPGQKPSPRNRRGGSARNNKAGNERERVLNDVVNTGVMAALIGGFALGNLQDSFVDGTTLGTLIYVCSVFSVHACTCSALTSALLYRKINGMSEEATSAWAAKRGFILIMPIMKFGMGCVVYLVSVLLLSYRALESNTVARYIALGIGIMSMSTVFMTVALLAMDSRASSAKGE